LVRKAKPHSATTKPLAHTLKRTMHFDNLYTQRQGMQMWLQA
jgi:hypothetical protein